VSSLAVQQAERTDVAETSGWRLATCSNRPWWSHGCHQAPSFLFDRR